MTYHCVVGDYKILEQCIIGRTFTSTFLPRGGEWMFADNKYELYGFAAIFFCKIFLQKSLIISARLF
jgi:hypothetical protein